MKKDIIVIFYVLERHTQLLQKFQNYKKYQTDFPPV